VSLVHLGAKDIMYNVLCKYYGMTFFKSCHLYALNCVSDKHHQITIRLITTPNCYKLFYPNFTPTYFIL